MDYQAVFSKNKKRILMIVLVFLFAAYTLAAVLYPPHNANVAVYTPQKDDVIASLGLDHITETSNCTIRPDGTIDISGITSQYVFSNFKSTFKSVTIHFTDPIERPFFLTVDAYHNDESLYRASVYCPKGCLETTLICPAENCNTIFIIDHNVINGLLRKPLYSIQGISLHKNGAASTLIDYEDTYGDFILPIVLLGGFLVSAIYYFLDKRFNYSMRMTAFVKQKRKTAVKIICSILLSALLSAIIEFTISLFVGVRSDGSTFNAQRFFFICGIILLLCLFISNRKSIASHPELVFLGCVIIIGSTMILSQPFGHVSWDIESHFRWVWNASYLRINPMSRSEQLVLSYPYLYGYGENTMITVNRMQVLDNAAQTIFNVTKGKTTIAHIPAGIFLAWARFAGLSYHNTLLFSEFANVLVYAFICYFGMKRLKSGKMILAVIALIPTSLFIAANFSYDYWVNCFTIYGIAYFISEMQQPDKPVTTKDTILMCGAIGLGCIPKLIYVPLMIIPLFLRKKEFKNHKKHIIICFIMMFIVMALFFVTSFITISHGGDTRGGSEISSSSQIQFILNDPLRAFGILSKFVLHYLSLNSAPGAISSFAYLGSGQNALFFMTLIFLTAFTDKNEYDVLGYSPFMRPLSLILFIGVAFACAGALYLDFTPVGAETVSGCQMRYMTPMLYPLWATMGWHKLKNPMNQGAYYTLILGSACLYNFYVIGTLMLPCWI